MGDPKEIHQTTSAGEVEEGKTFSLHKPTGDVDIAASYADQLTGDNAYTRKEWVRLRWKLDMRLVPLLWFNVTLGAMDKVTTATAALYGFRADTDLYGDRYSWVGSAFYVSSFSPSLESILTHG
jgi:MFS transporter, ACS family, allantoate permease